ncbi:hypothetical protein HDE_06156 [Halotydeus destructor]|nr:hypothetical protein HDE_06156 [Halotydeus destructor]
MATILLLLIHILTSLIGNMPHISVAMPQSSAIDQAPTAPCGQFFAPSLAKPDLGHTAAKLGDAPWVVQISVDRLDGRSQAKCVGTLLTPDWVLTSSACGQGSLVHDPELHFTISKGTDMESYDVSHLDHQVANVSRVVQVQGSSPQCELTLIQLDREVEFTKELNNVCYNNGDSETKEGVTTGWTSGSGENPWNREMYLTTVTQVRAGPCSDADQATPASESAMFCAYYPADVSYMMLPGTPMVAISPAGHVTLKGVACSVTTRQLFDGDFITMQSYTRISESRQLEIQRIMTSLPNSETSAAWRSVGSTHIFLISLGVIIKKFANFRI